MKELFQIVEGIVQKPLIKLYFLNFYFIHNNLIFLSILSTNHFKLNQFFAHHA